jgi:hypothetical protein
MMIWDLVFLTKWLAATLGLCSKGFGLIKFWINLAEIFVINPWLMHSKGFGLI